MLRQPLPKGSAHGQIMIDIDRFQQVNDAQGQPVGDRVMVA